jgi:hypothetical protein
LVRHHSSCRDGAIAIGGATFNTLASVGETTLDILRPRISCPELVLDVLETREDKSLSFLTGETFCASRLRRGDHGRREDSKSSKLKLHDVGMIFFSVLVV